MLTPPPQSHRKWHYTGPAGQPPRFVKWYCRSIDAPKPETIINLWHSLRCWLTGATVPWLQEWQEWQEELQAEAAEQKPALTSDYRPSTDIGYSTWGLYHGDTTVDDHVEGGSIGTSSGSTKRSAMALRRSKRLLTAFGLGGIYVTWTIFAWFIFTYGSLIYQLLGPAQQNDFARGCACPRYGNLAAAHRFLSMRYPFRFPQGACHTVRFVLLLVECAWQSPVAHLLCAAPQAWARRRSGRTF